MIGIGVIVKKAICNIADHENRVLVGRTRIGIGRRARVDQLNRIAFPIGQIERGKRSEVIGRTIVGVRVAVERQKRIKTGKACLHTRICCFTIGKRKHKRVRARTAIIGVRGTQVFLHVPVTGVITLLTKHQVIARAAIKVIVEGDTFAITRATAMMIMAARTRAGTLALLASAATRTTAVARAPARTRTTTATAMASRA